MKKTQTTERNWLLVTVASIIIILNVVLLVITAMNMPTLGWWSFAIAAGAILSIYLSVMAIRKNDPAWILLDLILPN